ncbi:hypothetical protein BDR04DRAFT_1226260 [Suillus decipiens]|nr:hypothetical protein BDR04DRAFT_1226260 [Suillus decipiens]
MPFGISRGLLFLAIYICNVGSIVILRNTLYYFIIVPYPAAAIVILASVSSLLALSVFPLVITCLAQNPIHNTVYLIFFGALCILHFPSCITLPVRARQDNATALCQDLMESDDCAGSIVLICLYYASAILSIICFVVTYIDRRARIPQVFPRYPNAQTASSHFQVAAIRYPQDIELGNVPVGKASNRKGEARG